MKNRLQYVLLIVGLTSVLFFCASATAGIANVQPIIKSSFSEPINMLLIGFGLIGFGTFMKSRTSR